MRWIKRDTRKIGIAVAGMLLLLLVMMWLPVSVTAARQEALGVAGLGTVTVQATPTGDATVTALNKEQLTQAVAVQQYSWDNWLWSNAATILSSFLSTLVIIIGVLIGFRQWSVSRKDTQSKESEDRHTAQDKELKDRQAEREKRADESFQAAVEGLSSERKEAKIGAAILLRTFLRPGYEQFYTQTFDLAVAHLCPTETPNPPEDPNTPLTLTTLRQALIVAFKEAFPLARSQNTGNPQSLDASYIQLDNAYLSGADLERVWMPQASMKYASLGQANLREAHLGWVDLRGCYLFKTDFSEATLIQANLSGANLSNAKLNEAALLRADLSQADLRRANLSGCYLMDADLSQADLRRANLSQANLRRANLSQADLRGTDLEAALSLEGTNLSSAKGLTKKQLAACKAKGAIIDEDPATSPSQSTVVPPLPSQNSDVQASLPPPDTDASSGASSTNS